MQQHFILYINEIHNITFETSAFFILGIMNYIMGFGMCCLNTNDYNLFTFISQLCWILKLIDKPHCSTLMKRNWMKKLLYFDSFKVWSSEFEIILNCIIINTTWRWESQSDIKHFCKPGFSSYHWHPWLRIDQFFSMKTL